jgi:RNA polymerase sigma-70 factor (ECF subfamily)
MDNTTRRSSAAKPTGESTDEDLMADFCHGSQDAFNELFLRYKQPLFGFFRRRVADAAQAEELTQESFVAVIRASSRYEPSALFRTYLYAIGLKILSAYRRKAAFRATFTGAPDAYREPAALGNLEMEYVLRQAVGKLDRLEREILMLREFEQLSYVEIGELLHLPVNTVRSRLFRARLALHNLLADPTPTADAEQARIEESA